MRYLLIIATILLIAEYSNIPGLFKETGTDLIIACDDTETEEEKKTEKDSKKFKSEKLNYHFDYIVLLTLLTQQKRCLQSAGLCLKGHCAVIDQPPEV
jgi:hypothetical protein